MVGLEVNVPAALQTGNGRVQSVNVITGVPLRHARQNSVSYCITASRTCDPVDETTRDRDGESSNH